MIIKHCINHGRLVIDDLIKSGKDRYGIQKYKCRLCVKETHRKHFEKFKDKIAVKQKIYRQNNPEKVKESKSKSRIKHYEKHREKDLQKNARYRAAHRRELNRKHALRKRQYIINLHDVYIRRLIAGRSNLKSADIPQSLIEVKKENLRLSRFIKNLLESESED